ncbi:MAG TPA: hypothetical protein G4O12_00875 [Dehalococcoidia bacterium]|nr:hypothetical protein [Dehalococcoidia bacterium]
MSLTVSLRRVQKGRILLHCDCVIFVHNHPSGKHMPSEDDIKLPKRLVESSKIPGIEIFDHTIVCNRDYLSMKGRNLL